MISYIEDHLHETFTLKSLAQHTGYSVPWISSFFKKETGQSIWEHLLQMRVDRAAKLLRETNLTITEIAFEVGFNSYTRFGVAFRKRKGMAPGAFRNAAQATGDTPVAVLPANTVAQRVIEKFRDQFIGTEIKQCWRIETGQWRQEGNALHGESQENMEISYKKPLPENFSIEFDFFFHESPHLRILFHGGSPADFYCDAILGKYGQTIGTFFLPHSNYAWKDNLELRSGAWQTFRLELVDNMIAVALDGREVFSFRDPFPPSYLSRNFFMIGSWNSSLQIRNFSLSDHGFVSLVPAVRQGDSLYNNGMLERARNAYERLLESANQPAEISELQYKIGMCFLRQQTLLQARTWFLRLSHHSEENDIWFRRAQEALLETERLQGDHAVLAERAQTMFREAHYRDSVRACLRRAKDHFNSGGFTKQAVACCDLLVELEDPGSLLSTIALMETPDLLFALREYDEARKRIDRILGTKGMHTGTRLWVMISLADCLSYMGKTAESERILDEIRKLSKGQFQLSRCDIIHGANLCTEHRFREAVDFLSGTPDRYPAATEIGAFAWLKASHIHILLHDAASARRLIDATGKRFPKNSHLYGHYRVQYLYPPLLLEGRFREAAEEVEAARSGSSLPMSANSMIRAGILFELSGNTERALDLWNEVARRFPEKRCCYYGKLAQEMAEGRSDSLEQMPYAALYRAEMFYLAGLLYKNRGESNTAHRYFELAVADDPTCNWFTWLAREELEAA